MLRLVHSAPAADPRIALAEIPDQELLARLRKDDEVALEELIRRKTKPLLQVVGRIVGDLEEARDVVQVTFLRVWENRLKFDERWSPNTWIYRIATNLAIDQLRSRQSRERTAEPVRRHMLQLAEPAAMGAGALEALSDREVERIFTELAADLSEKQRAVFLLREVEGLSSEEVAATVGCRESTVRNHLFHARRALREGLERRFPEYARAWRERFGGGDGRGEASR